MTAAAKIMDIISRLPGCDGQAADVVFACVQSSREDTPNFLQISKSTCPGQNHGSMEDPVVLLSWDSTRKDIVDNYGVTFESQISAGCLKTSIV